MRLLIFGDSIGQGYYGLTNGGWANLLFTHGLQQKVRRTDNTSETFNLSVSGDTVERVQNRLENEVQSRRWADDPFTIVFAIGFNDTRIDDNQPFSSIDQFATNLRQLHKTASRFSEQIVYIGLTSVNEAESNPWIFNSGKNEIVWTNDRIRLFDSVLRDFALQNNATFIPLFDHFLEKQKTISLHADGIHPNDAGHQLIYEVVQPVLSSLQ